VGAIEDVNKRGICTKYQYGLGGYGIAKINPTFGFDPQKCLMYVSIW